jgi:glutamate carboxypeptidase
MSEPPSAAERVVLDWLAARQDAMLALLEALVNLDSPSADKAGVDAVGDRIIAFLDGHAIAHDIVADGRYGNAILAAVGGGGGGLPARPTLLLGHRDTVFPRGEAARRPFRLADGRCYGPGCADMKSGLVMNAFVLAAFKALPPGKPGAGTPLVGLFTGDEEIGSPFSRAVIERTARSARAVFNAEPSRPGSGAAGSGAAGSGAAGSGAAGSGAAGGKVVIGRKGGLFMRLDVTGKAAHAGANFADGVSAIEEIARKIIALHALTDLDKGVTLNVGIVAGGQTVNTVAPNASAEFDLRFIHLADRDAAMAAIERIVAAHHLAGASAKLEVVAEFLPLVQSEQSRRLYEHYVACAGALGIDIEGIHTGGCADSGFAANVGAATLCATGPTGARAHSPEEYVEIASIVPRAQTLALAILRMDANAGL